MARRFLLVVLAICWSLTLAALFWIQAPQAAALHPASIPEAVIVAAEAVPVPPPPAAVREPPLKECPAAIDLVVSFEISSPAYYARALERPIWPGGASGVTIGIGYDLGYQMPTVIRLDWQEHLRADELPPAAGITGQRAKLLTEQMRHVITPLALAHDVFEHSTAPRYWLATVRAFPGIEGLRPCAQGALFSLVYNRGTAMAGPQRREMRAIRDDCVPRRDHQCISEQIRAMARIWRNTAIAAGMERRREAEALLVWKS